MSQVLKPPRSIPSKVYLRRSHLLDQRQIDHCQYKRHFTTVRSRRKFAGLAGLSVPSKTRSAAAYAPLAVLKTYWHPSYPYSHILISFVKAHMCIEQFRRENCGFGVNDGPVVVCVDGSVLIEHRIQLRLSMDGIAFTL